MPIPSITSALRKRRLRVLIAFGRRNVRLIQLFRRQGIIGQSEQDEYFSTAKGEKTGMDGGERLRRDRPASTVHRIAP